MSLRTPGLQVEIAVSNMDLYPWRLTGHPSWGSDLEQLVPFLERTGFHNFEIHPTHAIISDIQDRQLAGGINVIDRVIGSVHQTFNEGRGLYGKIASHRGVLSSQESVYGMATIAAAMSVPIPGVYFPDNLEGSIVPELHDSAARRPFDIFSVAQPSAEEYQRCRAVSPGGLLASWRRRGIMGFCPDTIRDRLQSRDGIYSPPPWQTSWPEMFASGNVYQMHVSAGRYDIRKSDRGLADTSRCEFDAFALFEASRARNTELGDMIIAAMENYVPPTDLLQAVGRPILRQVVEIPPSPSPSSYLWSADHHQQFVQNLADVIREAGATPILWGS